MNIILEGRESCPTCGWQVTWIMTSSIRVNKRSIRSQPGGNVVARLAHKCEECGTPLDSDMGPRVWRFNRRSRIQVDGYREAKGWL